MENFISIGNKKVIEIKIKEKTEKFIDLRDYNFSIDESRKQIENRSEHFTKVRESVGKLLIKARKKLPENIDFIIKEGYRPVHQQIKSYEGVKDYFIKNYPEFEQEKLIEETNKLCAPIEVAAHPTGAAIDLTLINKKSKTELDMGTDYNAVPHDTENATFLNADNISEEAKKNRKLLINVLESVGFICYPSEWWHWSYGDKYWAFMKKEKYAFYLPVEEKEIKEYL